MNLDSVPLWVWFVVTIGVILLALEAGYALGMHAERRSPGEKESPTAAMGGAVLGLVAFMLAFTFSIAWERFDTRKALVREDANAIRTAFLRADFLPEAERSEVQHVLAEYVDVRVAVAESGNLDELQRALVRSAEIHRQLWGHAVANGRMDLNSDVGALFLESINEIIDVHATRVAVAVETRIPLGIWAMLYALSGLGMLAIGYHSAIAVSKRSRTSLVLAGAFSLVIMLIAGLDRPSTPLIPVPQKPLKDLRSFMNESLDR